MEKEALKLFEEIHVQLTLIEMDEIAHEKAYDAIKSLLKGIQFRVIP